MSLSEEESLSLSEEITGGGVLATSFFFFSFVTFFVEEDGAFLSVFAFFALAGEVFVSPSGALRCDRKVFTAQREDAWSI